MNTERDEVLLMKGVHIAGIANPNVHFTVPEWTVQRGDFWVIGGFHGSGKTDLINTIAGLQSPAEGIVHILDSQIETLHGDQLLDHRKRIGVVFENGGRLFSRLTIFENLSLPLQYHSDFSGEEIIHRVAEVLTMTGLQDFASRRPEALNLSWQQRAALARALMLEPEILLLDRPFSVVELRQRRWWFDFLCRLSAGKVYSSGRQVTVIVTADDMHPWLEFGTHFAILKDNQFSIVGNASQFREQEEWREMWGTLTPD